MLLRTLKNWIVNTQHSTTTIMLAVFCLSVAFFSFFSNIRLFLFLCFALIMCFVHLSVYSLFVESERSKIDVTRSLIIDLSEQKIKQLILIQDLNQVILTLTGLILSLHTTTLLPLDIKLYGYFIYNIDFDPSYKNFII